MSSNPIERSDPVDLEKNIKNEDIQTKASRQSPRDQSSQEAFTGGANDRRRSEKTMDDHHDPINEITKLAPPEGTLAKILTKAISRTSTIDPGPPPDGGLTAWTQALMGHLIVFNTWGYINSFGVFQTYYTTTLLRSPSSISWVGGTQIFLLFSIGTFSGRATDYGLFRATFALGSVLQLVGVFATSLCTDYWQLFLAQGVCTGIGNGLVFCPTVALVSTYFSKKRALAIAITASGSATGGTVYPILVQQLLPRLGFGWTLRIIAFLMLVLQTTALLFTRPRLPPRKTGPLVDWRAFRDEPAYTLFSASMFLIFWGLYFAFYYIGSFTTTILHQSRNTSINNLLILNGVGLFGRLIPAYLADTYFGPLNTIIPVVFASGLVVYCWTAVHSSGGLVAFAVVYGLFAAAVQGLFPSTISSLTSDIRKTGVRIGMVFTVISFASLTGTPLAGGLIQADGGSYLGAQVFAGSVLLLGGVGMVACRVVRKGWGLARV